MQNKHNTYVTPIDGTKGLCLHDVDVAATLIVLGHELISIERTESKKVGFFFKWKPGIDKLINDYWFNKINVHPFEFATARKNLKSRLFALPTIQY